VDLARFKEDQVKVQKCVADADPTKRAILVFLCGLPVSTTGGLSESAKPDLWTLNDDCRVREDPRLIYANPLVGWDRWYKTLDKLVREDRSRPIVLVGHSMGGAALEVACKKLWDNALRADLVIAIDSVSAVQAVKLPDGVGKAVLEHLGYGKTVPLPAAPPAIVHIRAESKNPDAPGNWLRVLDIQHATEYQVGGADHTTVDAAPETLLLIRYLCSRLPAKGINQLPNVTPAAYQAVVPPQDLTKLPQEYRAGLKKVVVVKKS
jgi:hypothetical protein